MDGYRWFWILKSKQTYYLSKHSSDTFRGLNQILLNATTFRFDGSDLMPGAIGAGSFWTGMVDYTSGKSAKEVADKIQASWDAIK